MGQSQSARKITISNDDDVAVIKISSALAQRLANAAETSSTSLPSSVPQAQEKESESPKQTSPNELRREPVITSAVPSNRDLLFAPDTSVYTISAIETQRQMENELINREAYWKKRLQELKKGHENIDRVINEEYKKALSMLDNSKVVQVHNAVNPCMENKKKVLQCYTDHPKESLRCASLVEEFSSCVDQRRTQLMRCN